MELIESIYRLRGCSYLAPISCTQELTICLAFGISNFSSVATQQVQLIVNEKKARILHANMDK